MNENVLPTRDDADIPVRSNPVSIEIRRSSFGDWTVSLDNTHGIASGNYGPRPGHALTGLFDFLREIGGGDWTAFNRETGAAI